MLKLVTTDKRGAAALPHLLAASIVLSGAVSALAAAPAMAGAKSAQVQPDDQQALRIARSFRAAGDSRSAVPVYRAVLSRRPSDTAVQVELADTLLEVDMLDEAIGIYGAVDPKSPSAGDAELGLAQAELRMNQPARAIAHMDRAVALAPANTRVLVGRGVVLDRVGRHQEAQASYRKALTIDPRSVAARSDLALSLALTGQYDQALEILEPIARSANASPQDRQNLAFIYGLKGDRAQALALSRLDLGETAAEANARYFDYVRQTR